MPQGLKPGVDLAASMPGMNPRPTTRLSFSAACKARISSGLVSGANQPEEKDLNLGVQPKSMPQGLKPGVDLAASMPGMNPRPTTRLSFSAACKARISSGLVSGANQPEEKDLNLGVQPKSMPQGLKPGVDLAASMPGMNPRPTTRLSFSAACKARISSGLVSGANQPEEKDLNLGAQPKSMPQGLKPGVDLADSMPGMNPRPATRLSSSQHVKPGSIPPGLSPGMNSRPAAGMKKLSGACKAWIDSGPDITGDSATYSPDELIRNLPEIRRQPRMGELPLR